LDPIYIEKKLIKYNLEHFYQYQTILYCSNTLPRDPLAAAARFWYSDDTKKYSVRNLGNRNCIVVSL
jgi:hypothetical protein